MGKFIITKRLNGEFQFNLKSNNGLVILASEGYSSKANCENGIESVIRFSQDDSNFDRKVSKDRKIYFNLKSGNGQIIGTSQMYGSDFACDKGIASVKNNAANASVEDKTSNRLAQRVTSAI
ncbi:YegP family protein [Flavobacterium wongokense]|uniref:YegP family protein n=1 Tax=Flavobacterium wongokense TaxID=2910674 RepID=UPI001F246433|nr:YegP family protein [Flavobacterium sp. WG47]MCF6133235.1 YegP family protein [Flavobacterium sp. WG47]